MKSDKKMNKVLLGAALLAMAGGSIQYTHVAAGCGGGCSGCNTSCTSGCNTTCTSSCKTNCMSSCASNCNNTCVNNCEACQGQCQDKCLGGCQGGCYGCQACQCACSVACGNSCNSGCLSENNALTWGTVVNFLASYWRQYRKLCYGTPSVNTKERREVA